MSPVASALELRSVLIATDFSPASEKPLRHALAIARHYGSKLYLAHVVSSIGLRMAGPEAIAETEKAVTRDADHLEDELLCDGALAGLKHQFVITQGQVWQELEAIVRQEKIDLLVIGTHGRHGMGKLLLGSVAEEIFRHAECMVLTVGPGAYEESRVGIPRGNRTFLFATDFGEASLHALAPAISSAKEFGARLVLLNIITSPPLPVDIYRSTADEVMQTRETARKASLRHLEDLVRDAELDVQPEFVAEFEAAVPVSEQILGIAERLKVEIIIMGLHRSKHISTASHMPWATAYEIVCRAGCPVLTVRG